MFSGLLHHIRLRYIASIRTHINRFLSPVRKTERPHNRKPSRAMAHVAPLDFRAIDYVACLGARVAHELLLGLR